MLNPYTFFRKHFRLHIVTYLTSYRELLLLNLFASLLPALYLTLSKFRFANISSVITDGYTSNIGASSSQYTSGDQFRPRNEERIFKNTAYLGTWYSRLDT